MNSSLNRHCFTGNHIRQLIKTTMVHFFAISLFLLPIVIASGDEFWDDVDMIYNDLSNPTDLPTQATTTEAQPIEPMPNALQHSPLSDEEEENLSESRELLAKGHKPKWVTLDPADVEIFKRKLIIDEHSQDIPLEIIEKQLLELGRVHEWSDIHTYEVHKYPKYWAKVCVVFWSKPLEKERSISCIVSRSYANNKKRKLRIEQTEQYLDMLTCRCHTYISNCKNPLSTPETFLIHKGNKKEFFIFDGNESRSKISIKSFKDGITLPKPSMFERSEKTSAKFKFKLVFLRPDDVQMFNNAITIISNPQKVSLEELKDKLMDFEEVHDWPDLLKYDYDKYSRYWAKVCVFFGGKQLNMTQNQACWLSPSLGVNRVQKLFLLDRAQHFDLLYCKCHSYVSNFKVPLTNADTFLIHQSSANEFFVFEQRATGYYQIVIKDFKGGITLPNPENFN